MTIDVASRHPESRKPIARDTDVTLADRGMSRNARSRSADPKSRAVDAPHDFSLAARLWASIPQEAGEKFRPHCEPLTQAILQEIQHAVPEYAQPHQVALRDCILRSIEYTLEHCYGYVANSHGSHRDWRKIFRALGEAEFAEGRSLDSLQAAYRVGGRVAWRYIAEFGPAHDVSAEILYTCAEAIFAVVDEMSALSVEGYCAAHEHAAGTIELRRRQLLTQILSDPPRSAQKLASLAEAAHWTLPESVSMIALEPRADQHQPEIPAVHCDALVDFDSAQPCLLAVHPERYLTEFEPALREWRVVVGPHVPLCDAGESLRMARRAMTLVQQGVIPEAPVTNCTDHLLTLWLLGDEFLISQLCERSLAPLCDLTVKQRARLAETLLSWLQLRGSAPELAQKLEVHPQTVRYRMNQLEQIFGERLCDPDERLSIEIALRSERLLSQRGPSEQ